MRALLVLLLAVAPAIAHAQDASRSDAGPGADAGIADAGADAGVRRERDAAEQPPPPERPARARLTPIPGHAVFLLLVQLALLLITARLGSEIAKRFGLPAVVGELAAGIVLGPTVFGHYLPEAFAHVFPYESAQFHLLEVVGMLGMVLLLLLTGLETDLKLLRNLGRAAFIASIGGMVIPFAAGFVLGLVLDDAYLAEPDRRILFSLFLATAMAISAMPVIAKILMDLDLAKRNIGLVILSAGVVDDTAGWLILSMIAGAASHGTVEYGDLLLTLGLTVGFIAAAAFLLYPFLRFAMRVATQRFKSPETDLVLIVVVTLICAAATEWIGVHAVFGAFICGTVIRQVPSVREQTVQRLESFTFQILAPIFFGIVGLKVDLWTLSGGGGEVLALVLAVACFGKLFGCTIGSMWGGLRFWEALSIAVAMNARGAMELVVASIGLSLGILNQQMFSIIVMVAIVTSFMAPVLLRLTMKRVRMTEDEARRIHAATTRSAIHPERVRILLPTTDNENAIAAGAVAQGLAKKSASAIEIFHVDLRTRWWQRVLHPFSRPSSSAVDERLRDVQAQLADVKSTTRRVPAGDVAQAILEETQKGFDIVVVGASQEAKGSNLAGDVLEHVVADAPCHVVIVKSNASAPPYERLFVPFDGGLVARVATEFAVRYCESTGAELTLGVLVERRARLPTTDGEPVLGLVQEETLPGAPAPIPALEDELERISPIFKATTVRPTIERLEHDPRSTATVDAVTRGHFDLVVLGAENRAVQHKLFFGHEAERLIRKTSAAIAVVVPAVSRLSISGH